MNHISIKKIQPASSQNKSTTINLKNMANDRALTTRSKMAAALRKSRALSTPLSPFRCRPQKKKRKTPQNLGIHRMTFSALDRRHLSPLLTIQKRERSAARTPAVSFAPSAGDVILTRASKMALFASRNNVTVPYALWRLGDRRGYWPARGWKSGFAVRAVCLEQRIFGGVLVLGGRG